MKKALRPNEPGCHNLSREGYCEQHKRTTQAYDQYRESSAAKRGYNSKWRPSRAGYLSKRPLCAVCLMQGRRTPTVIDHIVPHKGDMKLFWDSSKWQPLCARATEDSEGGWRIWEQNIKRACVINA